MTDNSLIPYLFDNNEVDFSDGQPWMTQRGLMDMFHAKSIQAINHHIRNFKKSHPDYVERVIKHSLITASDGKTYDVEKYNLKVIIYVGYRLNETEQTLAFQDWVDSVMLNYIQTIMQKNAELYEQLADDDAEMTDLKRSNKLLHRKLDDLTSDEYDYSEL